MITSVSKGYEEQYRELFAVATDSLRGYDRVQTFDKSRPTYYTKNSSGQFIEADFINNTLLSDDEAFEAMSAALANGTIIYIKNDKDIDFPEGASITSLEEYFHWLPKLVEDENGNKKHSAFIKLPLDEPHFEINANTRAITIPANFKKNGIAVQGDDLAETVYFMIDRFVDYVDLNTTEIYIEWETPKDKDGKVTKHFSRNYGKIIDDKYNPGKLIFGWAISNVLTRAPGTLKFAVRFILRDNDSSEIIYSFNTLTASANIQATLSADLASVDPKDIDDSGKRLLERITSSEVVGNIQAAKPAFIINIVDNNYNEELGYDIETKGQLQALAYTPDTGMISYIWYKKEYGENQWASQTIATNPVLLTDEERRTLKGSKLNHRVFYSSNGSTDSVIGNPESAMEDYDTYPEIYEYRSQLQVNIAGEYKIVVQNRLSNSLNRIESGVVEYKPPKPIAFTSDAREKGYLLSDEEILYVDIEEEKGQLAYEWYKVGEIVPIEGAVTNTYIAEDVGDYYVKVIRTRNNVPTEKESGIYHVINKPSPVELVQLDKRQFSLDEALSNGINIEWKDSNEVIDYYIVQWYTDSGEKIGEEIRVDGDAERKVNSKGFINSVANYDIGIKAIRYERSSEEVHMSNFKDEQGQECYIIITN